MSRKIVIKAGPHNHKVAEDHRSYKIVKITNPDPSDADDLCRVLDIFELKLYIESQDRKTTVELIGE